MLLEVITADLIDRQELVSRLKKAGRFLKSCENTKAVTKAIGSVIDHIKTAPAVDAVEVVRCKDCVHGVIDDDGLYRCIVGAEYDEETGMYFGFSEWYTENFFCAHGERRADK